MTLSEKEAKDLLHAPDKETVIGCRDHALLFTYFITTCRASALAKAKVGAMEWTDNDLYLMVEEKGGKIERKALLEASKPLLRWIRKAKIEERPEAPLFSALGRDRNTVLHREMSTRAILNIVKKYANKAGIQVARAGRRDICTHSLRKTGITNALDHGAPMVKAQALAGHADIRTTQLYYERKEGDAEDAARHIQIR